VTELFKRGMQAAKRKDYAKAWKIQETVQIAANLGRAELKLGEYRDPAEAAPAGVDRDLTRGV
jgi:hypothetical protein